MRFFRPSGSAIMARFDSTISPDANKADEDAEVARDVGFQPERDAQPPG
jgi:hypothetical protein